MVLLITKERSERDSYYQSYMGRLDDIQTALKPLKKCKNLKYIFMGIFGPVKSFKTINRPNPTRPGLTVTFC